MVSMGTIIREASTSAFTVNTPAGNTFTISREAAGLANEIFLSLAGKYISIGATNLGLMSMDAAVTAPITVNGTSPL